MNLANARIAQVLIPVDDFEKGVSFYRDTLGLSLIFTAPPQMAAFNCDGVRLLVGVLPAGHSRRRSSAVYFQVPDLHAVHSYLRDKGVPFVAEPHIVNRAANKELWLAEFLDPDGNYLALMSEVAPRGA